MSKPNPFILLDWHLGLGDAIICNGIVRTLIQSGHHVCVPAWPHNVESVKALFLDLFEEGFLRILPTDSLGNLNPIVLATHPKVVTLGYRGQGFDKARWDESFYRQAGVPFIHKWTRFKLPGVEWDGTPLPGYIKFIHDDAERGFNIDRCIDSAPVTYRPDKKKGLASHAYVLRAASEVHCINSSFALLADLMQVTGKLYLHRYARPDGGELPIFGQKWNYID